MLDYSTFHVQRSRVMNSKDNSRSVRMRVRTICLVLDCIGWYQQTALP